MHRPLACIVLVFLLGCGSVQTGPSDLEGLSHDDARAWIHHTTPLPKQIEVTGKLALRPDQIFIDAGDLSAPLVAQAVKELRESLNQGSSLSRAASKRFTITLQLGGAQAQDLKGFKNSDQSYRILPDKRKNGLQLVALTPKGLYYASKTLQQLSKAGLLDGKVIMPLLTPHDWRRPR